MICVIGADQPAPAVGQQRERERDHEARSRPTTSTSSSVLEERVRVAVEVVGDPARAEAVVRLAVRRAVRLWICDLREDDHAQLTARRRPAPPGRARADPRSRRNCAMQLDREHADRRRRVVDHRPVLRLVLEQVGERVAQHVVLVDERRRGGAQLVAARARRPARARRASRAAARRRRPAAGRARPSSASLRRASRHRVARAHERRPPQVDVAHALQREALERPVGADEVLDERRRPGSAAAPPAARTGPARRPRAGSRSGRPS